MESTKKVRVQRVNTAHGALFDSKNFSDTPVIFDKLVVTRKIELLVAKGENPHAHNLAEKMVVLCQRWSERGSFQDESNVAKEKGEGGNEKLGDLKPEPSPEFQPQPSLPQPLPTVLVRALILLAEAHLEMNSRGAITYLTSALSLAHHYHLEYHSAIAGVVMANVQLNSGLPSQALGVLEQCLPVILAHGSCYERGRAMLLLVRCKLAASTPPPSASTCVTSAKDEKGEDSAVGADEAKCRKKVVEESIKVLEGVKDNFEKLEAIAQLKDVLLIQTFLYRELGLTSECNKCALDFKVLTINSPLSLVDAFLKKQ